MTNVEKLIAEGRMPEFISDVKNDGVTARDFLTKYGIEDAELDFDEAVFEWMFVEVEG